MVMLAKGTARMTKAQSNAREFMMKQAQRDCFSMSDEEWDKMQSEKIAEDKAKKVAYNKKSVAPKTRVVAIVHKKNGTDKKIVQKVR